ncbi:MAG TPA: TIGR03767 family metallophosphoesterase [Aeromicrobium sp.]|nr:TIGR03767 family metallophosphoesterase [Aeromicrobium sp.]
MSGLSRRSFLRNTLVAVGAAVVSTTIGTARRVSAAMRRSTADATIVRGTPGTGGYTKLKDGPPLQWLVRADVGATAGEEREACRKGILGFVQFSDIHVVDHQSPLRVEWLDRYEDPSSLPTPGLLSSAYRPHEMLSAHVSDSMIRAVNELNRTPVLKLRVSFVIETGDNSDNCQFNETRWYVDLLDGKTVRPDSGNYTKYEGVMKGKDPNYWHPHGEIPTDRARGTYGFPKIPGLLDKSRKAFQAAGLDVDWYSVFGNHDGLTQGNFPTNLPLNSIAVGALKIMSPPVGFSQANVDALLKTLDLAAVVTQILAIPGSAALVTPDLNRRILTRKQVVAEHFNTSGSPSGHGFTAENRTKGTAYYMVDKGPVRMVVLDTVNPNGYADGSLDAPQFTWMKQVIDGSGDRLVLLFSHHTSGTMANPFVATGGDLNIPRVLGSEVVSYLLTKPQVIAWVNGHTHRNEILAHAGPAGGFWEINTASHIDFPQQGRIIEIADNTDGTLSIFTTILDHAAPAAFDGNLDSPLSLAALSRELSANDWQRIDHGTPSDLNTELIVKTPPGYADATCDA